MSDEIKVYRINDCDWYAGRNLEECVAQAMEDSGNTRDDVVCEPEETTDGEMEHFMFTPDDGSPLRTFKEELQRMIAEGWEFPCMFGSTEN